MSKVAQGTERTAQPNSLGGITDEMLLGCYVLGFSMEIKKKFGHLITTEKAKSIARLLQKFLSQGPKKKRGRPRDDRIGKAYVRWMSGARKMEQFADLIENFERRNEDDRKQLFANLMSSVRKRRSAIAKATAAEAHKVQKHRKLRQQTSGNKSA